MQRMSGIAGIRWIVHVFYPFYYVQIARKYTLQAVCDAMKDIKMRLQTFRTHDAQVK